MLDKIKKNKKDICIYFLILLFSVIMCHNFLRMHYASDTWASIDMGYTKYANDFFLGDVRIFSAFSLYIADFLNLSIETFVVVMEFLAIIISCISVMIIYKLFVKLLNIEDKKIYKYMTLIGSYIIIFSHHSIEYYLFQESAIMCLSILFNILATRMLHSDNKGRIVKSGALLLMATFCYQGNLGIFVVINILITFIKEKSFKDTVKEIFKMLVLYGVVCLINIFTMKLINNLILNQEQYRITLTFDILVKYYRGVSNFIKVFVYSFNFIKPYTNFVVVGITMGIMLLVKVKFKYYIEYIFLIITGIGMCLYYDLFTTNIVYFQSRICSSVGILWGVAIIFLLSIASRKKDDKKWVVSLIMIFAVSLYLYTDYTYIKLSRNHIYANSVYIKTGNAIKKKVEEYETKTSKTVKYVSFYTDKEIYAQTISNEMNVYPLPKNVLNVGALTENPMHKAYCYTEYLNYFLQRDFEYKDIEHDIYLKYFKECDWDTFDETQILVDNETVYIATY